MLDTRPSYMVRVKAGINRGTFLAPIGPVEGRRGSFTARTLECIRTQFFPTAK